MALGYSETTGAVQKHVDSTDRTPLHLLVPRTAARMAAISHKESLSLWVNEAGFYSLIFGSKLPAARAFKKWVTSEVLPSLRRTGKYVLDDEHALIEAYDGMPIIYLGDVGTYDCTALLKFGWSDNIRERVKEHKKDFEEFTLQRVFPTSNNRQVEKLLKKHPEVQPYRLTKEIKGKNQTELLAVINVFKLSHIEALIHRMIAGSPHPILVQLRQSLQVFDKDVELKKLDVELKRLESDLAKRQLEHALQMARLKAGIGLDMNADMETDEVNEQDSLGHTDTDQVSEQQASQPPAGSSSDLQPTQAALQPYGVKLLHTLAAVWQMYIHEIKPQDDGFQTGLV